MGYNHRFHRYVYLNIEFYKVSCTNNTVLIVDVGASILDPLFLHETLVIIYIFIHFVSMFCTSGYFVEWSFVQMYVCLIEMNKYHF